MFGDKRFKENFLIKSTKLKIDLNYPIEDQTEFEKYDLVTDLGNNEHPFNTVESYKTMHKLWNQWKTVKKQLINKLNEHKKETMNNIETKKETMNKKTKPIKTLTNKSRKGRFVWYLRCIIIYYDCY